MQIIISGSFRPYYAKRKCLDVKVEDRPAALGAYRRGAGTSPSATIRSSIDPPGSYCMPHDPVSRRNFVLGLGASGLFASTATPAAAQEAGAPQTNARAQSATESRDSICSLDSVADCARALVCGAPASCAAAGVAVDANSPLAPRPRTKFLRETGSCGMQ